MKRGVMRFGIVKPTVAKKNVTVEETQPLPQKQITAEEFAELEKSLEYVFKDRGWLERALTHRSAPADGQKSDYERLEFVGDAVFDLSVAHLLSDKHPDAREGDLSKMRAALVNTASLAEMAKKLKLNGYIRLGRGEMAAGGAERPSILADVLEAVIGAIYLDGGYEKAFSTVNQLFGDMILSVTPRDPKTELQEALHAAGSQAPVYLLECMEGPEHAPTFVSVVEVDGEIVGRGRGATKKASQQEAASQALAKIKPVEDLKNENTANNAASTEGKE
jgi:ribonuclease-3